MAENRLRSRSGDDEGGAWTVKRSDLDEMSLGVAVPAAVASRTGANVLDLEPLSGVVDVDALDDVWGRMDSDKWDDGARVTFPYMGYEVSVAPGELHLEPLEGNDDGGAPGASG